MTRESDAKTITFWKSQKAIVLTVPHYDVVPGKRHHFPFLAAKRTVAVTTAKKLKYDHLLFIDANIIPPLGLNIASFCLEWMKALRADVVGVPYSIRWAKDGKKLCATATMSEGKAAGFELKACDGIKTPLRCAHMGFGCTMLHKSCFDVPIQNLKITDKQLFPDLVPEHDGNTDHVMVYEGEDVGFFTHCFVHKKNVYMIPDIGLTHTNTTTAQIA